MSKWVNTKKFEDFAGEKAQEKEETKDYGSTFAKKFRPDRGTEANPKEYELRLVPDPKDEFYKKYFYHMFQSGENWHYFLCPKTNGLDHYCPWCAISQLLWKGSESDKKKAREYSRKERYCGNVFVVHDPRDAEVQDDDRKNTGQMRLYEFPLTVEKMIKKEITDKKNGYGYAIFDPEEGGYSFLLAIGAKKPDKNKKVWPDYAPSMFARRPSAMLAGFDRDIEEVMEDRYDLEDYIKTMSLSIEDNENLLKSEMVWDDVETDFLKRIKKSAPAPAVETEEKEESSMGDDVPVKDKDFADDIKETEPVKESEPADDDKSDADLLAELDDL